MSRYDPDHYRPGDVDYEGGPVSGGVLAGLPADRRVHAIDRWLLRKWLTALGNPPISFVLWNHEQIAPADAGSTRVRALVRNRRDLARLLFRPYYFFGDGYSEGTVEMDGNLVELISTLYDRMDAVTGNAWMRDLGDRWLNRPRRNTLSGSRRHIHHHYDIGNEFYRLWLDREMLYTCAYFASPEQTLEAAQTAKMDHVCRKLRLEPGQRVVEAGCGWGSLALHMARCYGVQVRAFNISHEQIAWARERAAREGLSGQVEFVEDDYRNIGGRYDAFVSVGMLEHVGPANYVGLGELIKRCLSPTGLGLIHTIGRNRPLPLNPWIEENIFPGAYPPSLGEMMKIFEPCEFSILDVENLRLHYARTIEHWLERFEHNADQIHNMYDAHFVRKWRLYLAGSVAAFRTGNLQLFQVVFTSPRNNRVPLTRADLYRG